MLPPITGTNPLTLITPILPVGVFAISIDSTTLPYTVDGDAIYSQLEISLYNNITINHDGVPVTVGSPPITVSQFEGVIAIDQTQGDATIQFLARNYDPTQMAWTPGLTPAVGYRFVDANGYVQSATTVTGPTGASSPTVFTTSGVAQDLPGTITQDNGVTWTNIGFYQVSPTTSFTLIPFVSGLAAVIGPPSGVSSYKSQVACRLEWLMPAFPGTLGTKVMLSTDPAGVNPPYVQYGDVIPPTQVSRVSTQVLASDTTTNYDSQTGEQIITTTNQTQEFTYNYVDITPAALVAVSPTLSGAQQFYAMLSTVVQEPTSGTIFESQQNGPVTCGFVNLSLVSPTDFLALQRQTDIAGRLIGYMTQLYPDLDLTPRSEVRDLLVDPVSIELANASVREWFARVSESVSAMSQIDNANGDGISDPFNSSPIKQQLSRAFGLNANDTQTLIDQQFDTIGESVGLTRGGATSSVVTLTFYTYVRPTQVATFPVGILSSTIADTTTPALTFTTTGSAVVDPQSAASFYDPINGWWGVAVPASCTTTGSNTNAGAGTINSVSSGAPASWNVTNLTAAVFGVDEEINSHFASRIAARQVTGVDSGTRNGYLTTALATPGVVAAQVVAAGDTEMVRDWDPIRQKHVFGTVDVYVQGNTSSQEDDIVGFQYENTGTYGNYTTYISLSLPTLVQATGQTPFAGVVGPTSLIQFQVKNSVFQTLEWPLYQGVELLVSSAIGSFFLGVNQAQINKAGGYLVLNPNEMAYITVGSGPTQVNVPFRDAAGNPRTNLSAVTAAGTGGSVIYTLIARLQSPLNDTPTNQPVSNINSVVGQTGETGVVPVGQIQLVHLSDFLLQGGSNEAGDEVQVASTVSYPQTLTLTASVPSGVPAPTVIDTGLDLTVDPNGNIGNVLSVRSTDLSTLYSYSLPGQGGDYTIVASGPYRTYSLLPQVKAVAMTAVSVDNNNNLTVECVNDFGVGAPILLSLPPLNNPTYTGPTLDGQTVTISSSNGTSFVAVLTGAGAFPMTAVVGSATGSAIQDKQKVVVSYNKFSPIEYLNFASQEAQTLNGSIASTLNNNGFVYNTWLPYTYNRTDLILDGAAYNADGTINLANSTGLVGAQVPYTSRYIKVTFNGVVMIENVDFILTVNAVSGAASLQRNTSVNGASRIPDGGQVLVSYFYNEAFDVATEFPAFVPLLASQIAIFKHAAADVLVKAMVANPVDVTMTVVLAPGISADVIDSTIRTTIDTVLDSAETKLYQSELVAQVQSITGVQSVELPLVKCAKADGSYDIAYIIPTGTLWTPLASDPAFSGLHVPANSYITTQQVLQDSTIPSGGPADVYVGLLYQGQSYARTLSIADFITNAATPAVSSQNGSFYIIGTGDTLPNGTLIGASYAQKVIITIPADTNSPAVKSYFVTYQVFGETSASDILLSSTEYVVPGRITINYIASGS